MSWTDRTWRWLFQKFWQQEKALGVGFLKKAGIAHSSIIGIDKNGSFSSWLTIKDKIN